MNNLKKQLLFGLSMFILSLSLNSQTFKQIDIVIEQDSIDELESHPFTNEDVHGDFIIDGQLYSNVELHYRGAYYLLELINNGTLRNWKVKFPKSNKLENRREWNFNYEDFIRQNLAYKVFWEAEVPVVSAENVILHVNGQIQGLYLKYEDPDNKDWLKDVFGDNDGDLYKAGYDMPGQTKYFADLTYLGPDDSDYFLHYRKQTNKKGDDEFDYSSIRAFTELINHTAQSDFQQVILDRFDVAEFIDYLVVANFLANWDSYPFRPKNYFLYDNPEDGKWHYIPWDVDGTFQDYGNRNPIRTTGSMFHYFDGIEPYNQTPNEPLDRPLVWNIMEIDLFRDKYCYEYRQAIETFLSVDHLYGITDSIALTVANNTSGSELIAFNADVSRTKSFINDRMQNIMSELEQCVVEDDPFITTIQAEFAILKQIKVYPNPASTLAVIELPGLMNGDFQIQLVDLFGKTIYSKKADCSLNKTVILPTNDIKSGQYIVVVKDDSQVFTEKLQIIN